MSKIGLHLRQVEEGMTLLDEEEIQSMIEAVKMVRKFQGTLYLFGNGGSHATASHFANDLIKIGRVRAVCIGDMSAAMLAYGNDEGWEKMFVRPLEKLAKGDDGVCGVSCGGNSLNVIRALEFAMKKELIAVGMTGLSNESLINQVGLNALVHARVPDMRVQEDLHMMVCHAVIQALQEE